MTECRTDLCNTVSITIQNIGTFSLQKGESVLSVLKDQKLLSFSHCGGNGTCGRCAVQFTKGASATSTVSSTETVLVADALYSSQRARRFRSPETAGGLPGNSCGKAGAWHVWRDP